MSVLSVALVQKKTLLIGGGDVAAQKAKALLSAKYEFEVLAEEIKNPFFLDKSVKVGRFDPSFLDSYEIFIDATGEESVAEMLLEAKRSKNILINIVDKPQFCDFYFSALAVRDDVQIAVSSSGASPSLAQSLRDKIERILPRDLDITLEILKQERLKNRDKIELKNIAQSSIGKVFIIGCGSGNIKNLTLDAIEVFPLLDVALVDALVSKEIQNLLPKECKIVDVSKQKGLHNKSQNEINELLVKYAKEGLNVGRLKGGDPFIFGRLKEECDALEEKDISYEILNGVSSIFSAFNSGGIIPTIRSLSKGLSIVSAHLKESLFNDEWIPLLKHQNHTVVVLMAYSFASKIKQTLLKNGIDPNLPALFVSKIDTEDEKIVCGCVNSIDKMATFCSKPAILIIGGCASSKNLLKYTKGELIKF